MGLSWGDVGSFVSNVGSTVAKVAVAPITVPWQASAYLVQQGVGALRQVQTAIKPPAPAAPAPGSYADLFGAGGALASSAKAGGSSLPLILGGVAAAGLLLTAILLRRRSSS